MCERPGSGAEAPGQAREAIVGMGVVSVSFYRNDEARRGQWLESAFSIVQRATAESLQRKPEDGPSQEG